MNARIESTLTLEEVTEHFEQWRKNKRKGDRIPEQLWSEAVGLVRSYGVSRVARTLRLGGQDLNKRRGVVKTGGSKGATGGEPPFVEMEPMEPMELESVAGPESASVWMELERGDGMCLRIRTAQGVDMLGLVERFMETRSCCS